MKGRSCELINCPMAIPSGFEMDPIMFAFARSFSPNQAPASTVGQLKMTGCAHAANICPTNNIFNRSLGNFKARTEMIFEFEDVRYVKAERVCVCMCVCLSLSYGNFVKVRCIMHECNKPLSNLKSSE